MAPHAQKQLALTHDQAYQLISHANLVLPESFDYFVMLIAAWYVETSNTYVLPPNIFELFRFECSHSHLFYEIFIEGFACNYGKFNNMPVPGDPNFTPTEADQYRQMFMKNLGSMIPLMRQDIVMVLDEWRAVYVWDETEEYDDGVCCIKNNPIIEVW